MPSQVQAPIKNRCATCNWEPQFGSKSPKTILCTTSHCLDCGQHPQKCKCCKGGCGKHMSQCECEAPAPKAGMPVGGKHYGPKMKVDWDVPWVQSVNKTDFEQMWQTQYKSLDLCEIASDFYLLQGLKANIPNGLPYEDYFPREAKNMLDDLVARVDQPLQNYIDMAIGGELRYSTALQPILSNHRRSAWMTWKKIREKYGPKVLLQANDIFCAMGSGSYGGPKWGNACVVLHHRLSGKISREHWVDVCMNLQHNGGCFFNKIDYGFNNREQWGLSELQHTILPEHGREPVPDWTVLLKCASDDVRSLFYDYWKSANYNKLRHHEQPVQLKRQVQYYPKKAAKSSWNIDYSAKLAAKKAQLVQQAQQQKKYKKQIDFFNKKSNQTSAALVEWAASYIMGDGYDESCGCPGCSKANKVIKQFKSELEYLLKKKGYQGTVPTPVPPPSLKGIGIMIDDPMPKPFTTVDSVQIITDLVGCPDEDMIKLSEKEQKDYAEWCDKQDQAQQALMNKTIPEMVMEIENQKKGGSAGYLTAADFKAQQEAKLAKKLADSWWNKPLMSDAAPLTMETFQSAVEKISNSDTYGHIVVGKEVADALKKLAEKPVEDVDWDEPF